MESKTCSPTLAIIDMLKSDLHKARRLMADVCDAVEIEEGDTAILDFEWIRKLHTEAERDPMIHGQWEDELEDALQMLDKEHAIVSCELCGGSGVCRQCDQCGRYHTRDMSGCFNAEGDDDCDGTLKDAACPCRLRLPREAQGREGA